MLPSIWALLFLEPPTVWPSLHLVPPLFRTPLHLVPPSRGSIWCSLYFWTPLQLVPPSGGSIWCPLHLVSPPWSACSRSIWWQSAPAHCSPIEFKVGDYQLNPPPILHQLNWLWPDFDYSLGSSFFRSINQVWPAKTTIYDLYIACIKLSFDVNLNCGIIFLAIKFISGLRKFRRNI